MQKGFIVLAIVLLLSGFGWYLIHKYGSESLNQKSGIASAIIIVVAIAVVLFTQFKKKK